MRLFQLLFLIFLNLAITSTNALFANEASPKPQRIFVLDTFEEAIKLNDDFKHSVGTATAEALQEKRKKIELYQEKELASALKDCVNLLSSGNDITLANKFLKLIIAFENSADESISYAYGEIFLKNPNLIADVLIGFNKTEKKTLYRQLQWGFRNITYEKKVPEEILEDRLAKLKQIQLSIDR